MSVDLLLQLEQKVAHAVEIIELLRLQIEELEEENTQLQAQHEEWRNALALLIKRFDKIEAPSSHATASGSRILTRTATHEEELIRG